MGDNPAALTPRQRLGFLAKDSVLYGGAASFNKAFGLVTFPLLARHFSVEHYGLYDFLNAGIGLMVIVAVFGQDSAVARLFYEHSELETRQSIIAQSLVLQVAVLAVTIPLLWGCADWIAACFGGVATRSLLRLVLLHIPFMVLINFSQNILKWTFSRARFLLISLGSTVVSLGALIAALVWIPVDLVGVFAIFLVTRAIFGLLGLWFCRGWLRPPRDWRFVRPLLVFAAPLGVICTVSAFVPALERTFVASLLGARELGLFAVGTKIAGLLSLPIQAFEIAWGPFSLAIHKEPDAHVTYNQVLAAFSFCIIVLVAVLTVAAEPAIRLLASNQYAGASIVVFPLAMGLAVQGISGITNLGITISKKTHLGLYAYLTQACGSALAIAALIPVLGLSGVAWGGLSGRLAMACLVSWMSRRAYPLPWAFGRLASFLAITVVWGAGAQIAIHLAGIAAGAVFAAFGVAALVWVGLAIVFTAEERQRAIGFMRRRMTSRGLVSAGGERPGGRLS